MSQAGRFLLPTLLALSLGCSTSSSGEHDGAANAFADAIDRTLDEPQIHWEATGDGYRAVEDYHAPDMVRLANYRPDGASTLIQVGDKLYISTADGDPTFLESRKEEQGPVSDALSFLLLGKTATDVRATNGPVEGGTTYRFDFVLRLPSLGDDPGTGRVTIRDGRVVRFRLCGLPATDDDECVVARYRFHDVAEVTAPQPELVIPGPEGDVIPGLAEPFDEG